MYELRTTLIAAGKKAAYDSVAKTFQRTNKYLHGYSREQQNTISRYKISHESVYGDFNDMSRHDLLQVVMVRIPSEQNKDRASNAPLKLHEMLYAQKNKSAGEMSELCDIPLELVEQIQDKLLQNASLQISLISDTHVVL